MNPKMRDDLLRFQQMAFVRTADCTELIKAFHSLGTKCKTHPSYDSLCRLYQWVHVPLTLWPIDILGLAMHLLQLIRAGKKTDPVCELLLSFLPEPPDAETCDAICEYEHGVKLGEYEKLVSAQVKYDSKKADLLEDPTFNQEWKRIKEQFDVRKLYDKKNIIRRRMLQERNFRPQDWKFSWESEKERFQITFDAFCHRWVLYGMEGDKPLLQKLSVNLTPFGTIIFIPSYWSFDPKRDLRWKSVTALHRMRGVHRQGPKLSDIQSHRQQEARMAIKFLEQATSAGLKGEARNQWIMGKLGWNPGTDHSKLRRLIKNMKS